MNAWFSDYTVFQKKTSPFLLLLCQMSADLADLGRDYRSFNLQCPSTYLLETEILSIVEYQLKCCSVADNAAADCHMVCSGAACCRQGHQWVAWMAASLGESWRTTLWYFCSEPQTSLLDWFYCLTLLTCTSVIGTLSNCCLLYKVQFTVATCKARFGGLNVVKFLLQNSSDMCLLKLSHSDGIWQTCSAQ